jgi:hypothetical protein
MDKAAILRIENEVDMLFEPEVLDLIRHRYC